MDVYNKLSLKIDAEIEDFRKETESQHPKEIYEAWYRIGFYEEYYEMLACDFTEENFSEDEVAWLLKNDKPLGFLYGVWLDCDGAFDHSWDAMADWIHLIYSEREDA